MTDWPQDHILDDAGEPVPCDVITWGVWFQTADRMRVIAADRDEGAALGGVEVSTVFLGLNMQWREGPPILWESLVFGGPLDGTQRRYTSRAAALRGHQDLCRAVAAASKVIDV